MQEYRFPSLLSKGWSATELSEAKHNWQSARQVKGSQAGVDNYIVLAGGIMSGCWVIQYRGKKCKDQLADLYQ